VRRFLPLVLAFAVGGAAGWLARAPRPESNSPTAANPDAPAPESEVTVYRQGYPPERYRIHNVTADGRKVYAAPVANPDAEHLATYVFSHVLGHNRLEVGCSRVSR
jgi:hypothetical protein